MKKPSKTLIALLSLGLMAGLVIAWNPSNLSFNTNQFSAVNPNISIKSGALTTNLTDAGTVTASSVVASGGSSNYLGGQTVTTNLYAAIFRCTVATAPSSPITGSEVYFTDMVTPSGTGGKAYYDGTNWRSSKDNIIATADIPTFMFNAYGVMARVNTPSSYIEALSQDSLLAGFGQRVAALSGGTVANAGVPTGYGNRMSYSTGGGTTGSAVTFGVPTPVMAANTYLGNGAAWFVTALPTSTDNYWAFTGITSAFNATYATSGAFFLFDMYTNRISNATVVGALSTSTSDWIAVVANSGTYAYYDTGLPATTSSTTPNRLWVTFTNGAAIFSTNGVTAITITTNLPTGSLFVANAGIVKFAGTTTRSLVSMMPGVHIRQPAPTFP